MSMALAIAVFGQGKSKPLPLTDNGGRAPSSGFVCKAVLFANCTK